MCVRVCLLVFVHSDLCVHASLEQQNPAFSLSGGVKESGAPLIRWRRIGWRDERVPAAALIATPALFGGVGRARQSANDGSALIEKCTFQLGALIEYVTWYCCLLTIWRLTAGRFGPGSE